ncbi:hypothetical protein AgCh_039390 [Apium graveolens]
MSFDQAEIEFDEEGSEDENEPQNEHEFVGEHITTIGASNEWTTFRENLANLMFSMESRVDTVERGAGKNKRKWTEDEDGTLIESLLELVNNGAYKACNSFKPRHLAFLKSLLNTKIPTLGLKGKPHIESRLKTLKKDFTTVYDLRFGSTSGFGWDPESKVVTEPKDVWDSYVKNSDESTCRKGSKKRKGIADPMIEAMYNASKLIVAEFASSTKVIAAEFASSKRLLIAAESQKLEKKN